jgi:RNA polymerase sigma-70 factor, ECF subfamily
VLLSEYVANVIKRAHGSSKVEMALESQLGDGDLLEGMVAGDEQAFVVLYRRWQGSLYRFALQMTGNPGVAEEITQEVFLTLMREPKIFDPSRGPLQAFLFGVCRNFIMRRISEESRYVGLAPVSFEDGNGSMEPVSSCDLLSELTQAETAERVRRAVLTLPLHHREAVVLCDLQDLSYEQVAAALGCPVGTVRSRLHRARELLLLKLKRSVVSQVPRAVAHAKAKISHELSDLQDDCA